MKMSLRKALQNYHGLYGKDEDVLPPPKRQVKQIDPKEAKRRTEEQAKQDFTHRVWKRFNGVA